MLNWLSGAPQDSASRSADPEPPETPAHMFIGRAFRQAIFGTPAPPPTERKPRTDLRSNTTRERSSPTKPTAVLRRKSADQLRQSSTTPSGSPARRPGILLTPGTANGRRKTVSFDGDSGQGIGGNNSGLVDAPRISWATTSAQHQDPHPPQQTDMTTKQNNSLTNRFIALRRTAQDAHSRPLSRDGGDGNGTADISDPQSESGRYWKAELEKSATEMRRLAKKEQLAKQFAKHRDEEALQLAEDLRREQRKTSDLQKILQDYTLEGPKEASGPRRITEGSELREARAAAREAEAQITTLKQQNDSLQWDVKTLQAELEKQRKTFEDQIARLRRENDALQGEVRSTRHQSRSRSPIKRSPVKREPGSDIWADVAGGSDAAAPTQESCGRGQRSPLRPRVANFVGQDSSPGKEPVVPRLANFDNATTKHRDGGKASKMTDERREAAQKRLEERRKAREKGRV